MRSIGARASSLALWLLASGILRAQQPSVAFDWFEYRGHDAVFERALPAANYRNPVLAGFYPDPSITNANGKFYLVNSTFTYFPGIPVFQSEDLVHWRQIGNVIDRPTQLNFDGLDVSRGVFAASIRFHHGMFYLVSTAVDAGGNFVSVAANPGGPWSDPAWLPQLDGIDPSLFFDDDGRSYLLNNGPPPGPARYDGHRAIWIQRFDLATRKPVGTRKLLLDGGVDFSSHPVWIEGPHMYKRRGWYYLMCAEGGTSSGHSEVVLRARSPWGPFSPYPGNPILTQRDLPPVRSDPIAAAGHADLIEAPDGRWWAVFLAVRTYDQLHYNIGRETFLLPVAWRHGWPVILPHGEAIPYMSASPTGIASDGRAGPEPPPTSGNFTWRDDFDAATLQNEWLQVRTPSQPWIDLASRPGWLTIHALPASLDTLGNPSFLARRQQHMDFEASTALQLPESDGVAAGIGVFQNENYWYFFGTRRHGDQQQVFLQQDRGHGAAILATIILPPPTRAGESIRLRVTGHTRRYSFFYAGPDEDWHVLIENDDGVFLSTDVAGGFVGTVIGPYARAE